jgi:uncharacterized protein YdiU (UPF0061 family)
MHHLGIPTTRALCLVGTGEDVIRDLLYDGNPRPEPGAIVCRVAPSFLRFGNFELLANRNEVEVLRKLADYVITSYFPELGAPSQAAYLAWFSDVCRRTARLLADWMAVGFVHGVMNTDNMSVLGLTIDYGPYGFLDGFDPNFTPNITDRAGRRYRYGTQPRVAHWNLACLANALLPLIGDVEALEAALNDYAEVFRSAHERRMADKLGLLRFDDAELTPSGAARVTDTALVGELFEVLGAAETDWTLFFRHLSNVGCNAGPGAEALEVAYYDAESVPREARQRLSSWLERYRTRLREDGTTDAERKHRMDRVNPKYLLRNYVAQLAIERAEQGDASLVNELLELLRRPFDEQPDQARFAEKRPDWAKNRPGCSMLSCSS